MKVQFSAKNMWQTNRLISLLNDAYQVTELDVNQLDVPFNKVLVENWTGCGDMGIVIFVEFNTVKPTKEELEAIAKTASKFVELCYYEEEVPKPEPMKPKVTKIKLTTAAGTRVVNISIGGGKLNVEIDGSSLDDLEIIMDGKKLKKDGVFKLEASSLWI